MSDSDLWLGVSPNIGLGRRAPTLDDVATIIARGILCGNSKVHVWFRRIKDAQRIRRTLTSRGIDCSLSPDRLPLLCCLLSGSAELVIPLPENNQQYIASTLGIGTLVSL